MAIETDAEDSPQTGSRSHLHLPALSAMATKLAGRSTDS